MASHPDQAALARPRDERAGLLAGPLLPATYVVVFALLAWPIFHVAQPLLTDYPNHLARLYVGEALATSDTLARFYVPLGGLYPYLPFDVLVSLLARVFDLETAGRLFIASAIVMPGLGTLVLTRALHGRAGLWPIVSALFAYNLSLSWGLITFLFSLGVALAVFAGWIVTASWSWKRRLAAFAVLSSFVFCLHPFAFTVLGLLIGTWEIGQLRSLSRNDLKAMALRLCLTGLQFIPALFLARLVHHADFGSDVTAYGTPMARVTAVLSPILFLADAGELVLAAALMIGFVIACQQGLLTFERRLMLPLIVVGIGAVLMPVQISGVYLTHLRLPLVFVLIGITAWRPRPMPRRTALVALAALATVLLLRTATIADRMAEADREVDELRAAGASIEEGARVLPVLNTQSSGALPPHAYWHATAYLTMDRNVFYPLLFSFFNIGVRPEYVSAASPATSPVPYDELDLPPGGVYRHERLIREIYWRDWRNKYDYIVLYDFGQAMPSLPPGLTLVRRGTIFSIYKID